MINQLVDQFNEQNLDPCWKTPGSEMWLWAKQWEQEKGNNGHGLGDLSIPHCDPKPGTICPACGKDFTKKYQCSD